MKSNLQNRRELNIFSESSNLSNQEEQTMKTKAIYRKHYSWGKLGYLIAAAVIGLISGYAPETLAATPTIFMQSATINGAADAVTLTRVPVQNAAGTIIYKDISMFFDVDSLGNVTLPPALVKITPSPTINVGAFKPGTYNGYSINGCTNDHTFKVGSPGVGSGGRISGSIQRIEFGCGIFNASWTSGPIAGHPLEVQLKAAGITSTAYNWGIMGTADLSTQQSGWIAGDIVGVVQTGNQLSLVNFKNKNIAKTSLTFTLCPTANPC
jgi:hypothetical protein